MRFIVLLSLSISCHFIAAQNGHGSINDPSIFFRFEQIIKQYAFFNPGSIGSTEIFSAQVGSQSGQAIEGNSQSYFHGAYVLPFTKKRFSYGIVGANVQTDKEGPLLSRNRFNFLYAWNLQLNHRLQLAMGMAVGAMNYQVKSTPVSGGGNSSVTDGSIGLWLHHEHAFAGLSINQIFKGELTPINTAIPLVQHYIATFGNRFESSQSLEWTIAGLVRVVPSNQNDYYLTIAAHLQRRFTAGITTRLQEAGSVVCFTGLENMTMNHLAFDLTFAYSVPTGSTASQAKVFSIDLGFNAFSGKRRVTYSNRRR